MAANINYWLLSDAHLGHDKVQVYCGRPKGFEEKIFEAMKKCIKPDDILIFLGDLCMKNDKHWNAEILKYAPKTRWFVRGNHDPKSLTWYIRNGWSFAGDSFSMIYGNKNILFSHEPKEVKNYDINIHGHFHNNPEEKWEPHLKSLLTNKHYLISIEESHYCPTNLLQVVSEIQKRSPDKEKSLKYTKEDIEALFYRDAFFKENVNSWALSFDKDGKPKRYPIANRDLKKTLDRGLEYLCRIDEIEEYHRLVYEAPLNEMPLYINDPGNKSVIAKWRVAINK